MSEIRVDAATVNALRFATSGAKLIGPDGESVGSFMPTYIDPDVVRRILDEERRRMIDEANAEVTMEELIAADRAGGEIPHEEVLKRLGLG